MNGDMRQPGAPIPLPPPSAPASELADAALDVLKTVLPLLPDYAHGGFAAPGTTLTRMMDTLLRAVQLRDKQLGGSDE